MRTKRLLLDLFLILLYKQRKRKIVVDEAKKILTLLLIGSSLILMLSNSISAQQTNTNSNQLNYLPKLNTIFVEVLGNGGQYSINYDKLLSENWSLRGGIKLLKHEDNSFMIPVMINFLIGWENNKLELGGGVVLFDDSRNSGHFLYKFNSASKTAIGFYGTFSISYRYQQIDGGSFFKIGYTPFWNGRLIQSSVGISVGTTF